MVVAFPVLGVVPVDDNGLTQGLQGLFLIADFQLLRMNAVYIVRGTMFRLEVSLGQPCLSNGRVARNDGW